MTKIEIWSAKVEEGRQKKVGMKKLLVTKIFWSQIIKLRRFGSIELNFGKYRLKLCLR